MRKRVLHLRSSSAILGAERVILELGKHLPEFGFDPVIGVPIESDSDNSPLYAAALKEGIAVQGFPISNPFDVRALNDINKFVIKNEIQIVHSHGYREDLYALACSRSAALVATNHLWKQTTWRLRLYAKMDAFLLRRFPKVVAVSDAIALDMQSRGIQKERIDVIANGVDTESFSNHQVGNLRNEFGFGDDDVILGTVSSLTGEKAIHHAISAFARCTAANSTLRLLVVGDGPDDAELRRQTSDLGINDRVVFTGRRSDVPAVLATINVFLLTSLIEGLPMAMLEAMASGLPVIATAVGDIPKVVDDDVGCLIQSADENALVEAINRISKDGETRETMGRNAKQRIVDHYSSRTMTKSYVEIYNQLTPRR